MLNLSQKGKESLFLHLVDNGILDDVLHKHYGVHHVSKFSDNSICTHITLVHPILFTHIHIHINEEDEIIEYVLESPFIPKECRELDIDKYIKNIWRQDILMTDCRKEIAGSFIYDYTYNTFLSN